MRAGTTPPALPLREAPGAFVGTHCEAVISLAQTTLLWYIPLHREACFRRLALRPESLAPLVPGPVGRGSRRFLDQDMGIQFDNPPDTPIPNPAAVREEGTDGWTLLVNPDTAGAMAVNQTGALIWKLIDGRRTTEEIAAAVRDRFPDAPDTVAEDVRALLTKLAEEGFVGREIPLKGVP